MSSPLCSFPAHCLRGAGVKGRGRNHNTSGAWIRQANRSGQTKPDCFTDAPSTTLKNLHTNMPGIVDKLLHNREKSHGVGTNSHAVKYLNQDFESLRDSCLERGRLFEDDCFEALPSSLGFNELGPNSYKVRGITWKRPTVEYPLLTYL